MALGWLNGKVKMVALWRTGSCTEEKKRLLAMAFYVDRLTAGQHNFGFLESNKKLLALEVTCLANSR